MALYEYSAGSGVIEETIDFAGDYDVYQVELIGGFDYFATAMGASNNGGTLIDPYLAIYDSQNGELLHVEDDSQFFGYDPLAEFQAPYSGIYDVVVFGYGDSTGSYTFDLNAMGEPISPGDIPVEEWGTVVG
jgi:hypothetical protein